MKNYIPIDADGVQACDYEYAKDNWCFCHEVIDSVVIQVIKIRLQNDRGKADSIRIDMQSPMAKKLLSTIKVREGLTRGDTCLEDSESLLQDSIESLGLCNRISNALAYVEIRRVGQLVCLTEDQVLSVRGIARDSLRLIIQTLQERGLSLSDSISLSRMTPIYFLWGRIQEGPVYVKKINQLRSSGIHLLGDLTDVTIKSVREMGFNDSDLGHIDRVKSMLS